MQELISPVNKLTQEPISPVNKTTQELISPVNIPKTMLSITGIVIQLLKSWFSVNGDQFLYDEDLHSSKLVIDMSYRRDFENIQNRPGIYVKRGAFQPGGFTKAGIDDVFSHGHMDGSVKYAKFSTCRINLFLLSKNAGEVEKLARKVYDLLVHMSPVIRRDYDFKKFDVVSIGEHQQHKESADFYQVPIVIDTMFVDIWRLKLEAPVLKNIMIEMNTGITKIFESEGIDGLES